jgi:hypothetical protein
MFITAKGGCMKKLVMFLPVTLLFLLAACGNDNGTSAERQEFQKQVEDHPDSISLNLYGYGVAMRSPSLYFPTPTPAIKSGVNGSTAFPGN